MESIECLAGEEAIGAQIVCHGAKYTTSPCLYSLIT